MTNGEPQFKQFRLNISRGAHSKSPWGNPIKNRNWKTKRSETESSRVRISFSLFLALRTGRTAALLNRANERARMCPGTDLGWDGSPWSLSRPRPGLRRRQMKCQKCEAKLHKPLDGWKINSSAVKRRWWGGLGQERGRDSEHCGK